jgi:peptidoglycan/LPS O-acetylase OafA/YrhL
LVWLGDVSHSFTVAISLVFARVSFTLVERPGMRIGPA